MGVGRVLLKGALVGAVGAVLLALVGWLALRSVRVGLVALLGVPVGFVLLLIGLGCSALAYWLAQAGRNPALRAQLVRVATALAGAGMACGLTSTLIWALVGRPTIA